MELPQNKLSDMAHILYILNSEVLPESVPASGTKGGYTSHQLVTGSTPKDSHAYISQDTSDQFRVANSSIPQMHVIGLWEVTGVTGKLHSPPPRGFEPTTFLSCPHSANQLVSLHTEYVFVSWVCISPRVAASTYSLTCDVYAMF